MSPVIHIVDDDALVRAATSYLLTTQGYVTQIYSSGEELLSQTSLGPGCILLDLRMPGPGGTEVMAELTKRGVSLPVVMMSGHGDLAVAVQAMKLGAVDFIEKPYQERHLVAVIERALEADAVRRDKRTVSSAAAAKLDLLSPRERQILRGLLAGLSNKGIARRLGLSPRTVEMHRANMMNDLGVASLSEAVRIAIDADLLPLDEENDQGRPTEPVRSIAHNKGPARQKPMIEVPPPLLDVLEGTLDGAFLLDRDWRFAYLNKNATAALARGGDLIGQVVWEAFPLSTGTKVWDNFHRTAADGQPTRFEFYSPDLEAWFEVNARSGTPGLQVFFRDVTSARRVNASLRLSEEALLLALDSSGDGAWDWNIETGDIAMSARFLEQLGYQPDVLPGRFDTVREMVHPDDWPRMTARLADHVEGRTEFYSCEYRLRRGDGSWCWNFDRGRIVARDPASGAPTRMVGCASDVTARKQEEERAQEAFQRLALAQKNAGAGTWDLDLVTRQVRLCSRSLELHGLRPDGPNLLSEEEWRASLDPDDAQQALAVMIRAIESGGTYEMRDRTFSADGGERWVLGLGKAVLDHDGKPRRFVGLNQDITERVHSRQELKQVQAEIAHLSRLSAMGAIASTLAHELNQPLTAVSNFLRGIRRSLVQRAEADEPVMSAISGAEKSARYAADVVRRLREHVEQGIVQRKPERLSAVIAEAISLSSARSGDEVAIVADVAADADRVLIDRVQIEQVLLNLIRNGTEAMAAAGCNSPVEIAVRRAAGDEALVRVSDAGPGLDEEVKQRLFASLASTKQKGMGLGLSICRTIIEEHHGRIWAEDNPSGGASFYFTLPRAQ
ncbi:MAG: response regulator, partial [Alphaproteobacteria bacterium]|nr:response regulator [Alphaproteobacteria bacterium]